MSKKSSAQQFLLLVRESPDRLPEPSDAQIEKMFAWFRDLKKRGHLVSVRPLEMSHAKILRGERTVVTDGPYAEAKEVVGGYMIITAKNLRQATAIAKEFPMFVVKRTLEVRQLRTIPGFD